MITELAPEENTTELTTFTATDVDGDALTYSVSGGADEDLFQIDSSTGVLTFISAPDYENPLDADTDGDEASDGQEKNSLGSDPLDPDTDEDGIEDGREVELMILVGHHCLSPTLADSDFDGLTDKEEVDGARGGLYPSFPCVSDSDNDGIYDSTESGHNLDTNFDGLVDNADLIIGINGLADNLETIIQASDFNISPSFNILKLLAFNVSPVEVISVIISEEPVKG